MKNFYNDKRLRQITAGLCLAVILAMFFGGTVLKVNAQGQGDSTPVSQPTESTPTPPPGFPDPIGDAIDGLLAPSAMPSATATPTGTVTTTNNVFNYLLSFPFETMKDALVNSMVGIMGDFLGGGAEIAKTDEQVSAMGSMVEVVDVGISWMKDQSVNEQTRFIAWRTMLRISLILVPLSLILTMAGAMKEGVSSVISYANAREAISEWVFSVALMASSYYVINLALKGSGAMSNAILDMMLRQPDLINFASLGRALFFSYTSSFVIYNVSPIVSLFLFFFDIFGIVALVGSIVLSSLAQGVGVILATALAPLIYILSALRPLSWLKGMWLKLLVVLVLLPPINMLLLTIGATLILRAYSATGGIFSRSLLGILTMVGVVSVVITLNAAVGKMVYGAAIDVAKKAWGATKAVIAAIASVAAFAAAPAVLGAMGGGAAAGAGSAAAGAGTAGAGAGLAGAGTSTSAAAGSTPGLGTGASQSASAMKSNPMTTFGKNADVSQMSDRLGSMLSRSSNPILRGVGNGMNARSMVDSFGSARQASRDESNRIASQPAEIERGMQAGRQAMEATWASNTDRTPAQGFQHAQSVFQAANLNGVSTPQFLEQTGWLGAAGGNLELATSNATQYYGTAHSKSLTALSDPSSNVYGGLSAPRQAENNALHQAAVFTSTKNNGYPHSNDPVALARDARAFELAASRPGSSMGKTVEHANNLKSQKQYNQFVEDQLKNTAGHL